MDDVRDAVAQDDVSTAHDDAGPRAPWPAPDEWPADDAPPLAWVRFYTERMGWTCYPTPSPLDLAAYRGAEYKDALRDVQGGEASLTEEERQVLLEYAGEAADKRKSAPLKGVLWTQLPRITPAMASRWWGGARGLHRGVCIRPAYSALGAATGWPVVLSDVDPRHGGDLLGEWATLPGPQSATPRGGRHTLMLASGQERQRTGGLLAPGVDLVATTVIRVPSGSSSTDRVWTRLDAPEPAPPATRAPAPMRPRAPRLDADGAPLAALTEGSGRAADALRDPAGVGARNPAAQAIVGMLARPRSCPDDVVAAALEMLAEHAVGRDQTAADLAETTARWRHALTRGPRDVDFAIELVCVWVETRDDNPRPWRHAFTTSVVRNLWKTCDRREEGEAGAEDLGVGPAIADVPEHWDEPTTQPASQPASQPATQPASAPEPAPAPDMSLAPAAAPIIATGYVLDGPSDAPPPRRAARKLPFAPGTLFRSSMAAYSREAMTADENSSPLALAVLPPFQDFVRQGPDEAYRYGHGLGPWFSRAFGGLKRGSMVEWGAAGAKAGKTHFVGQFLEGLALQTAYRIIGVPGYEKAPWVLVFWITEMPHENELAMRFIARNIGYDARCTTSGDMSANDIRKLPSLAMSNDEIVTRARTLADIHYRPRLGTSRYDWRVEQNPNQWRVMLPHVALCIAREQCINEIDLAILPPAEGSGRSRVAHDGGPLLVEYVAEEMKYRRTAFCATHGIDEDDVTLIATWDPAQRFAADGASDSKTALDDTLKAINIKLARRSGGVHACVIITSDTTKEAAKNMTLSHFVHDEGRSVAASIFAGSQALQHNFDPIGLMAEPSSPDSTTTIMRVRLLQTRSSEAGGVFPFRWEMHTGRFLALDPASVPEVPPPEPGGGFGRSRPRGSDGPAIASERDDVPARQPQPAPFMRPRGRRYSPDE